MVSNLPWVRSIGMVSSCSRGVRFRSPRTPLNVICKLLKDGCVLEIDC